MENSANKELQLSANDFKDIANVPIYVWVIFLLLGLTVAGVTPVWLGVLGSIIAVFANNQAEKAAKLKEARSRAASYANMIGPIVVGSDNPEENVYDVQEKAKAWREKLRLSGNPWADVLPIIEYPYSPMLYGTGQLSAGWNLYQKQLAEMQHMENIKWHEGKCPAQLKALFASAVLPSPNGTTQSNN